MIDVASIPDATYRLQFGSRFSFQDATAIVPYLHELGISHVYASPFLRARPGSTHGYDITDHNALNPEVGSPEDFETFSDTLRAHGMGLILDFVPNHMGIGQADNEWWLDVLEWGQSSIYADFFDINWMPRQRHLQGKVLLPLLGDHYGAVLERGEIELKFDSATGSFSAWYHEHRFPIRPRHYAIAIRRQLSSLADAQLLDGDARSSLERLAAEFDKLRRPGRRLQAAARDRALALKTELAEHCRRDRAVSDFIASATAAFKGVPGDPRSFLPLHGLLERQVYRLAFWRVAADEINYRRFFNISDLVGIRMERRALFDLTHRLVGRLIASGRLQGLRLDHIDGLFDPRGYCRQLQAFARGQRAHSAGQGEPRPFYVVVEKILARHENLPDDWPVAGSTGYEFANLVNGLFVDPRGQRGLERAYAEFAARVPSFDETLAAAKGFVVDNILASEINVLANELDRISERHWGTRDFTGERMRAALKEIVVNFPVYRTYVAADSATATDRRDIDWAVSQAKRGWRGPDPEILDFVRAALTTDLVRQGRPYRRADVIRFAMKFQQYTGPVTAKAMEDTSFYRHHLLLSLNEVGGDPRQFGVSPAAFHHANRQRSLRWPHSMLATATHDTKRGEDARTRLDVLSEMPEAWNRRVRRWSQLNRGFHRELDGASAPSRNDEFAIYQALLGAWPAELLGKSPPPESEMQRFADRVAAYAVKAIREAKLVSSWDNPNIAYEEACTAFVVRLLDVSRPNPFLSDFRAFLTRIAYLGMLNSLSQTTLKLTAPGVPDVFQGTEVWDLSLVDPDNRRDVDFQHRRRLLSELTAIAASQAEPLRQLLAAWPDGRIKLWLMHRLLRLRREVPALLSEGSYEPLAAVGKKSDHALAFLRRHDKDRIIVVVGRLFSSLLGLTASYSKASAGWSDTRIVGPDDIEGGWNDALTGRTIAGGGEGEAGMLSVAAVLAVMPVAVLMPVPRQ
jgi:malto-oligosyltrehalose synthase